jgi:hypothetical protein
VAEVAVNLPIHAAHLTQLNMVCGAHVEQSIQTSWACQNSPSCSNGKHFRQHLFTVKQIQDAEP